MKNKKNNKTCYHRKSEIKKFYIKNYPFGKKSKPFFYTIKKCIMVCKGCGLILNKWKPII